MLSDASQSDSSENKTNSRNSSPVNNEVDLEELGIIDDEPEKEEKQETAQEEQIDETHESANSQADVEVTQEISKVSREEYIDDGRLLLRKY